MTLSQDGILNVVNLLTVPNISSTSTIFGNTCNTNFLSLSNNKGQLYNYDYTLFSSLILQHPYAMQFSINGAVPPLQTSNSNILMTMDASNGIDVNCFLACETSLSVLGETQLIGNVISNITCTKSLNISGNSLLRSNLTVSGTSNFNNVIVNDNITTRTLFIIGTSTSFINSNNMLNINGIANGVNLYNGANQVAMFNSSQISLQYNTKLVQSKTSDNSFIIQNTLSGPSSLHLFTNTTLGSRIYQNPDGNLNVSVNVSGTSILPLSIYSNGVINCNASNAVNNKQLVLFESGAADTPSTATNFFGLGIISINSSAKSASVPTFLIKILPKLLLTAVSGLPPTLTVFTTVFVAGSMIEISLLFPLQVIIFFENSS